MRNLGTFGRMDVAPEFQIIEGRFEVGKIIGRGAMGEVRGGATFASAATLPSSSYVGTSLPMKASERASRTKPAPLPACRTRRSSPSSTAANGSVSRTS